MCLARSDPAAILRAACRRDKDVGLGNSGSGSEARLGRIWRVIAAIPRGCVATYGGIARQAGLPGRARLVGHALKVAPAALRLPWHRVLGAGPKISLPAGSSAWLEQRRRLEAEGHRFRGARLVGAPRAGQAGLDEWLWGPPPDGR